MIMNEMKLLSFSFRIFKISLDLQRKSHTISYKIKMHFKESKEPLGVSQYDFCFGHSIKLVCSFVHMHGIIKNNHNYTFIYIYIYFMKRFKLYIVLAYTFFKSYIFKICNGFSLFIYIFVY